MGKTINRRAASSIAWAMISGAVIAIPTAADSHSRTSQTVSSANCANKPYLGNGLDIGGVRGGGLPVFLVFPGDPRTWQVALRANS